MNPSDIHDLDDWRAVWEPSIVSFVREQMADADSGHDLQHVKRVVANAIRIGQAEQAVLPIYLPAAWLHDCVSVPKNSPDRSRASTLAAAASERFLEAIEYPSQWRKPIAHCILAHSFSANVACETLEAQIVQDADRLEALGAIGIARCLMTGGAMKQRLYHPEQPWPTHRAADDREQSLDHFFVKLLKLHGTMQTHSGREEAYRRTQFMIGYLKQLGTEIGIELPKELMP